MKILHLENYSIELSAEAEAYRSLHIKYKSLAQDASELFDKQYNASCKSMDDVFKNCPNVIHDHIEKIAEQCITDLAQLGIFNISKELFIERYFNNYETWQEDWDTIIEPYLKIICTAEELDSYRTARRESRGRWVGGGFGLGAAAKGALQAGAINIASNLAHGAFNLAAKSVSDAAAERKKSAIFSDKNTKASIINALNRQLFLSHYALADAINDNLRDTIARPSKQDTQAAASIISNIDKDVIPHSSLKQALFDAIKLNPFNEMAFIIWLNRFGDPTCELESIASYFGHNCIAEEKKTIINNYRQSLNFTSPDSARESLQKLFDHSTLIGRAFSPHQITAEKERITIEFKNNLRISTPEDATRLLPKLEDFCKSIEYTEGFEKQAKIIDADLEQKRTSLAQSDQPIPKFLSILKTISVFIIFLITILIIILTSLASNEKEKFFIITFFAGISYILFGVIKKTKGSTATGLINGFAHIFLFLSTIPISWSLAYWLTNDKTISRENLLQIIFSTTVLLICAWKFHAAATNLFRSQGLSPQGFILRPVLIAAGLSLIPVTVAAIYLPTYFLESNSISNQANHNINAAHQQIESAATNIDDIPASEAYPEEAPTISSSSLPETLEGTWLPQSEQCQSDIDLSNLGDGSWIKLTSEQIIGYEWRCEIISIEKKSNDIFIGQFSCSSEGESYSRLMTLEILSSNSIRIESTENGIAVSNQYFFKCHQ